MAERFQRLYSLPSNLYREGSPVVIEAATLLKDSVSGNVVAQFKFRCVSNRKIRAVKLGIDAIDVAGIPLPGIDEYQYLDLSIDDGDAFGSDKAIIMPSPVTRSFSVRSLSVILWDGTVWSASDIGETDALPVAESLNNTLKDVRLVNEYKALVCDQAKFSPVSVGELWRCTCGAWNHKTICRNCRAKKVYVLDLFSTDRLTEHLNKRIAEEQAKQAEKARQEEERKVAAEKRKKRAVKTCVILAIVLLLVLVVVGIIVTKPYRMIKEAEVLIESGQYVEAISLLQEVESPDKTQALEQNVFSIMEADIQAAINADDYARAMELIERYSVLSTSEENICAVQSACPHTEQQQAYRTNSCTDDGFDRKTCVICGHTDETILAAPGHTFETSIVEEPTCSEKGKKIIVCTTCKEETIADIPLVDHLYEVTVHKRPSCTDEGAQTKTCSNCGHTEEEILSIVDHDYVDTVVEKATCTSGGKQRSVCSMCGNVDSEEETEPLGHAYAQSKTDAPTCIADGKNYYRCDRCSDVYTTVVSKLGHAWAGATCENPKLCSRCGLIDGNPLGHNWGYVPWKMNDADCERCGEIYSPNLKLITPDFPYIQEDEDGEASITAIKYDVFIESNPYEENEYEYTLEITIEGTHPVYSKDRISYYSGIFLGYSLYDSYGNKVAYVVGDYCELQSNGRFKYTESIVIPSDEATYTIDAWTW